jgi:hypothetical protein
MTRYSGPFFVCIYFLSRWVSWVALIGMCIGVATYCRANSARQKECCALESMTAKLSNTEQHRQTKEFWLECKLRWTVTTRKMNHHDPEHDSPTETPRIGFCPTIPRRNDKRTQCPTVVALEEAMMEHIWTWRWSFHGHNVCRTNESKARIKSILLSRMYYSIILIHLLRSWGSQDPNWTIEVPLFIWCSSMWVD